jgi:hypothetical protein
MIITNITSFINKAKMKKKSGKKVQPISKTYKAKELDDGTKFRKIDKDRRQHSKEGDRRDLGRGLGNFGDFDREN